MKIEQALLISHSISNEPLEVILTKLETKIKQQGDQPNFSIEDQLQILSQLAEFDLGRFLLQAQGLNGYWTHYLLTYPWFGKKTGKSHDGKPLTTLERFCLERSPVALATQQRFEIFLKENQKQVKNHAVLACIPCGMMGELLYLDYSYIDDIKLVGVDYDPDTLKDAQQLAERQNLSHFLQLLQKDAWNQGLHEAFDLISSNGLNIYEPDHEKVQALYNEFYKALKPEGKLVTSFLTHPPGLSDHCEWAFSKINQDDLLLQKIIWADIIGVKWQCFRSSEQTKWQLESAGFTDVQFIYDEAKIFPTVTAYKKL